MVDVVTIIIILGLGVILELELTPEVVGAGEPDALLGDLTFQ